MDEFDFDGEEEEFISPQDEFDCLVKSLENLINEDVDLQDPEFAPDLFCVEKSVVCAVKQVGPPLLGGSEVFPEGKESFWPYDELRVDECWFHQKYKSSFQKPVYTSKTTHNCVSAPFKACSYCTMNLYKIHRAKDCDECQIAGEKNDDILNYNV